jgi:RNA polymerase sigma-70 factor (ECF subfamily)
MNPKRSDPLPNEADSIARAQEGDKEAYRVLVEGYKDRLFGVVVSLVKKREQAEDLIQEIFIKAYFALPSFEGQSAFYTWLFRIASNHCLDYLRKRQPLEISLDGTVDEDGEMARVESFEAPDTERPEASLEEQGAMAGLLASLEPEQRLILTLRELEGYSYEELADLLNCGVNTIKSRLNRAREALKQAYVEKFGNIPDTEIVQNSEGIP